MTDKTKGVVPGSRLDAALRTLRRPERRILLATITGADTPRRARLERRLKRRLEKKGIVI